MPTDNARPQDVGRRHDRRGARTDSDAALIERWRAVERMTLERVTVELEGIDKGTGLDGSQLAREYPSTRTTADLIDLGVKIARDLGADIDPTPVLPVTANLSQPRRSRKLDL